MSVYLGYNGFISLTRKSTSGAETFIVQPSEINTSARRFRLSLANGTDLTSTYFTGDRITLTRTSGNLDFIDATGFADSTKASEGSWYINIDELGGIRLYTTLAAALAGTESEAVLLDPLSARFLPAAVNISTETITVDAGLGFVVGTKIRFRRVNIGTGAPSGTLPGGLSEDTDYYVRTYNAATGNLTISATSGGSLYDITSTGTATGDNRFEVYQVDPFTLTVALRNNLSRVLAKTTSWELNTNREVVDTTVLSDQFRNQYSALISGSGSLSALWSFNLDENSGEYSHYLLQLITRTEIGSEFGARLFLKRSNTGSGSASESELYYAFDAVITAAGVLMAPDRAVEISIDFVTTGQIRLLLPTPSDELLVAAGDALLVDDAGDKLDL